MRTLWRLARGTEWKIVPHAHRRHAPTSPCRTRHVGLPKYSDPAGTSISPFRYQSTSVLGGNAWLRGNLLCFAWLHHLGPLHSGDGDHESAEDGPGTSICRLGCCSLSLRVPCFRVGPALQRQADRTRMSEASPKQKFRLHNRRDRVHPLVGRQPAARVVVHRRLDQPGIARQARRPSSACAPSALPLEGRSNELGWTSWSPPGEGLESARQSRSWSLVECG